MGPPGRMQGPLLDVRIWILRRGDSGVCYVGVRKVEIVSDDGEKRRDGEGGEEAGEER